MIENSSKLFDQYLTAVQTLDKEIRVEVEKRFNESRRGGNVSEIDQNIRKLLSNLDATVKQLQMLNARSNLNTEKREIIGNVVSNFGKLSLFFEVEIANPGVPKSTSALEELVDLNFTGAGGNPDEISKLLEKNKIKNDAFIEESNELIKKIQTASREIAEELKSQEGVISNLTGIVDQTKGKVERNSSNFDSIVEKTSNGCLFGVIGIEVLAIVLLLIV